MHRTQFRYIWLITLLISSALACNFLSGLGRDIREIRETGQAAITQVQGFVTENAPMIETARAFATQEGGSLLETAQAVATENPGLLETAKAFATQGIPDLKDTLEAAATDHPELAETLKAIATDQPDAIETLNALATRYIGGGQGGTGEIPEDIPIVDQTTIEDLYVTGSLITYTTSWDFKTVLSFYKEQMAANGWKANEATSIETGSTAFLNFEKTDRSVTLILTGDPSSEKVSVVIQISPK